MLFKIAVLLNEPVGLETQEDHVAPSAALSAVQDFIETTKWASSMYLFLIMRMTAVCRLHKNINEELSEYTSINVIASLLYNMIHQLSFFLDLCDCDLFFLIQKDEGWRNILRDIVNTLGGLLSTLEVSSLRVASVPRACPSLTCSLLEYHC